MTKKSNRPLNNFELVEQFLENALGYDIHIANNYEIIPKIVSTELNIENFDESLISKNSKSYRLLEFRKDNQRLKLQNNIVLELLSRQRLDSDEENEFGKGGAFPKTELKLSQDAYILVGLPASEKSGIANIISDKFGCLILDSDFAKRKLPEFDKLPFGATLLSRFKESGRYVSLSLIFDTYNNSPSLAFYKIITFNAKELESYGIVNTVGSEPTKIFSNNSYNPANLFK